jgi:hypothetical protein
MPAKSIKQQRLFGIALSMKRGETPYSYSPKASKLAKSMTETKLKEFASTPHEFTGNPNFILDLFCLARKLK